MTVGMRLLDGDILGRNDGLSLGNTLLDGIEVGGLVDGISLGIKLGSLDGATHRISVKHIQLLVYPSGRSKSRYCRPPQSFPLPPKVPCVTSLIPQAVCGEQYCLAMSYPPTVLGPQYRMWASLCMDQFIVMLEEREIVWVKSIIVCVWFFVDCACTTA